MYILGITIGLAILAYIFHVIRNRQSHSYLDKNWKDEMTGLSGVDHE